MEGSRYSTGRVRWFIVWFIEKKIVDEMRPRVEARVTILVDSMAKQREGEIGIGN